MARGQSGAILLLTARQSTSVKCGDVGCDKVMIAVSQSQGLSTPADGSSVTLEHFV
jgi:hypothetical protein